MSDYAARASVAHMLVELLPEVIRHHTAILRNMLPDTLVYYEQHTYIALDDQIREIGRIVQSM